MNAAAAVAASVALFREFGVLGCEGDVIVYTVN